MTTVVNAVYDKAKSIQFGNGFAWSAFHSNKVDKWAEATCIYKSAFMLTKEVSLDLIEDTCESTVGFWKYTELPSSISAPEENSLRKVLMPDIVDSNGHEVIVLDTFQTKIASVMKIQL